MRGSTEGSLIIASHPAWKAPHQIELVAALNELGDARQIESVESLEPDLHAEGGQIIVYVGEVCLDKLALDFLPILVGPLQIGFGERCGLEQVQGGEGLEMKRRVFGQVRYDDIGQELAHDVALKRIAVEKDEGSEADIQRLLMNRMLSTLLSSWRRNGSILFLQHDVGMLAKRQRRDALVLADHRQNIPRRFSSRINVWNATNALPSSNSPSAMPSRTTQFGEHA
jgi:hypothetical protein